MSAPKCPNECEIEKIISAGFSDPVLCISGKRRQRYKCTECGVRFSENFFNLNFRLKKPDLALNSKIFSLCLEGLSNRAIGRWLQISPHCVRIRLVRMGQQSLSFHAGMTSSFSIQETICYDGLRNFARSQYDPNDINQALGRDSLFIYDFNFAAMNRKGHTSPWQKIRLSEIEQEHGRYNPKAIRIATENIFLRLYEKVPKGSELNLLSDEHFRYKEAIKNIRGKAKIAHVTVSSKACRNFQNILFSVNHADLKIRINLRAFTRETIAFSKTAGAMCLKYALFITYKNYMSPQFTKKHVRRPEAHQISPAQSLGICEKTLAFADIFHKRSTPRDLRGLSSDWKYFWNGKVPPEYERSKEFLKVRRN